MVDLRINWTLCTVLETAPTGPGAKVCIYF